MKEDGRITERRSDREAGLDPVEAARALAGAPDWEPIEIDAAAAEDLLTGILHRDLAYQQIVMPLDAARRRARRFVGEAGAGARFFTNTRNGSWMPLSQATFDAAVIRVDSSEVTMLLVEDED